MELRWGERLKKALLASVVVAVATAQLLVLPVSADAGQWAPTLPSSTQWGLGVADTNVVEPLSLLEGQITSANNGQGSSAICAGDDTSLTNSPDCDFEQSDVIGSAQIVLPACTSSTETDCVVSLSLGASSSSLAPANFIRQTDGPSVAAIPSLDVPAGSTESLWQSSVADADGSTTYAVGVEISYLFDRATGAFSPVGLGAVVQPYGEVSGTQYTAPTTGLETLPSGQQIVYLHEPTQGCAWEEAETCGVQQDFTSGTVTSLSVRIPDGIGGWLFGRMQDPALSVTDFDATSHTLTVTAESVPVPAFEVTTSASNPDVGFTTWLANQNGYQLPTGFPIILDPNLQQAIEAINDLRGDAANTASGVTNDWSFNSFPTGQAGNCFTSTSQVQGFVTTNALAYSRNPPTFANGYLSYEVAGMHYLPGGSLALGTYNLVLADSVARCLYGFTNAPISASISVTENDGTENVATTSVADTGGWLYLSAGGFTFSDPVIKIKLKQKGLSSTPSTIFCTKGASVKHVRAINPRCPSGYRRANSK